MDFMLLFIDRKDARAGEPAGMAELGQYAGELARVGKLRRAAPLGSEPAASRRAASTSPSLARAGRQQRVA